MCVWVLHILFSGDGHWKTSVQSSCVRLAYISMFFLSRFQWHHPVQWKSHGVCGTACMSDSPDGVLWPGCTEWPPVLGERLACGQGPALLNLCLPSRHGEYPLWTTPQTQRLKNVLRVSSIHLVLANNYASLELLLNTVSNIWYVHYMISVVLFKEADIWALKWIQRP